MSIDVVPAFDREGRRATSSPTPAPATWIATNPKRHHELSIAKNAECDGKFVPFVKMIKGINRELGEPVSPSFLLEVMAHALVKAPFGRYQDEIVLFLATAAEQHRRAVGRPGRARRGRQHRHEPEPEAGRGRCARAAPRRSPSGRVDLEDDGQERAAYDEWKKLFGNRMTRP